MQLTKQERIYFEKVLYKDFILNKYLVDVGKSTEMPSELIGLMCKLEADAGVVEEVKDES